MKMKHVYHYQFVQGSRYYIIRARDQSMDSYHRHRLLRVAATIHDAMNTPCQEKLKANASMRTRRERHTTRGFSIRDV